MILDLNALTVESFETDTSAPEVLRTTRPVTNFVVVCAAGPDDGTLALMQGPSSTTENPEYC